MSKRSRLVVATLVLAAVAALGFTGATAIGDAGKRTTLVTIKMKMKRGVPVFKGPKTTIPGAAIQILNKAGAAGPHTFSLVTKDELPQGERERVKCGRNNNRKLICKDIANAHEMTGLSAGIQDVDNGAPGWNTPFDGEADGDSWFTQTQLEEHTRNGPNKQTKLYYMCIIFPRMQGKLKFELPG